MDFSRFWHFWIGAWNQICRTPKFRTPRSRTTKKSGFVLRNFGLRKSQVSYYEKIWYRVYLYTHPKLNSVLTVWNCVKCHRIFNDLAAYSGIFISKSVTGKSLKMWQKSWKPAAWFHFFCPKSYQYDFQNLPGIWNTFFVKFLKILNSLYYMVVRPFFQVFKMVSILQACFVFSKKVFSSSWSWFSRWH